MDESRLRYDEKTRVLSYDSEGALPAEVGKTLGRWAREGMWRGKPVASVEVCFADTGIAAKQADAMAFLGLVSRGPSGVAPSSASFSVRSDFGVEE